MIGQILMLFIIVLRGLFLCVNNEVWRIFIDGKAFDKGVIARFGDIVSADG
ncbi:hypothetical protein [Photobacterium damselae]